jgi:tripeptide aminopeptidase
VRNAAGTILGSDNKAAVVVMLEAVRRVLEEGASTPGSSCSSPRRRRSRFAVRARSTRRGCCDRPAYVYDQGAPVGEIVLGSPHGRLLDFRFHGTAAHAGMHPEDGPLGHSPRPSTGDRGLPARARRRGDERQRGRHLRGHRAERRARVVQLPRPRSARTTRTRPSSSRARCSKVPRSQRASSTARSSRRCARASPGIASARATRRFGSPRRRLERAGYTPSYALSGGGADANVFNARGLQCVNLANGMMEIHTPDEHIAVADLEGMVEVHPRARGCPPASPSSPLRPA